MISSMRGGGSEQQTLLLCRKLPRDRFDVSLWCGDAAGPLIDRVPTDVDIRSFTPPPSRWYYPGRQFRLAARRVRQLAENKRIDVVYDRTFGMTMIAAAAVDRIGVPRVSTIVSPPSAAVPMVERRFVAIKRRRLSAAYRRSAAVVAVSDAAADDAAGYYRMHRGRIETIVNPVDGEPIRRDAADGQPAFAPSGRSTIVVVGRMTAEKGHEDFLHAAGRLPDSFWQCHRVCLIGDGPLRTRLESLSGRLSLTDNVLFAGSVDNAAASIAAAKLLVLPSRFEGLPNVVLEAMTLRTAVIATAAGGTPQLCPDPDRPTMTLVPPNDPSTLAIALESIAGDDDGRQTMIDRAAAFVAQHHDAGMIVRRIADTIDRAATSRRR